SCVDLPPVYAAVAGGRYPVEPHGLPPGDEDEGLSSFFARGGRLDDRRARAPMLDLLGAAGNQGAGPPAGAGGDRAPMRDLRWAGANQGTGRRAALSTPTFGKTGTTQNNRDALFIGFAGNLVVGVWVGHDDDRTLGRITGGTAPAEIWRRFMAPAVAIDGRRGPPLPAGFRVPERREPSQEKKSPLPDEWSDSGEALRRII